MLANNFILYMPDNYVIHVEKLFFYLQLLLTFFLLPRHFLPRKMPVTTKGINPAEFGWGGEGRERDPPLTFWNELLLLATSLNSHLFYHTS